MLGETSRAVRFDWRSSKVGFALQGAQLLELNNFGSASLAACVRFPVSSLLLEFGLARAVTWPSPSSGLLSLTPYRQSGRPSRFELQVNVGYPLAEGVATARPGFLSSTQLVLLANASVRYLYYPGSLARMSTGDVAKAVLAPRLSSQELENLELARLPSMQVDVARYALLAGLSLDVYLANGVFLSPRAMVAIPLVSGFDGSGLGFWWELALSFGWTLR